MPNINKPPLDKNGKRHGEWLYYYNNGNLTYRFNYIHGIPHGFCEYYYQNGTLCYRGYWNMGIKVGYWYYFYQPKEYYLCLI